jgi:hypothetical protein
MSMFGKFRDKFQTLKADLKEKAEHRAPKDLMAPLQVDMEKIEEMNSKNRLFGRERERSRSGSRVLADMAVKTGRGTTIRSDRQVMDDLEPSFFDVSFDAKGYTLDEMTVAIPRSSILDPNGSGGQKHPTAEGNPFSPTNGQGASESVDPFSVGTDAADPVNAIAKGNPFLNNSAAASGSSSGLQEQKAHSPVGKLRSDSAREKTDMYLMEQISQNDRTKDIISRRLMGEITLNYDKIIKSMQHVNEIDMDVTRASISVKAARTKLKFAKDTVVQAGLKLARERRKKHRMSQLRAAVRLIKGLSNIGNEVSEAVEKLEFVRAESTLKSSTEILLGKGAVQFSLLDEMRQRQYHTRKWLRRQVDKELESVVLKFNGDKYGDILWSYHISDLHSKAITDSKGIEDELSLDAVQENYAFVSKYRLKGPVESNKGIAGMAERIQRIFLNATETTLRRSVDPTLSGPVERRLSFAANLGGSHQNDNSENELEYIAACEKLTPSKFVDSLRKSLLELTEYLHSHFLCTQWHRDAYSALNADAKYLHRPNRTQDEIGWENASGKNSPVPKGVDRNGTDEGDTRKPPSTSHCHLVARGLAISRHVIWDAMQERIAFFVSSVPIVCPSFKLEHVVDVYLLLQKIEEIGKDFLDATNRVGDESKNTLAACRKEFLDRYMTAMEKDIFSTLDNFLARENWERLHISLEDLGGMNALVLRHSSNKGSLRREQIVPSKQNAFELFLENGSPILSVAPKDAGEDVVSAIPNGENGKTAVDENNEYKYEPLSNDERVLTSTSVNGFAKFTGACMQVMEKLPTLAYRAFTSAFLSLNYYMHAVINLFLPSNILVEMMKSNLPNDDMNGVAWRFGNLRETTKKISTQLRDASDTKNDSGKISSSSSRRVERSASLNNEIEGNENSLFGLEKCCSASESLFFLMEVLEFLRPRFVKCLGQEYRSKCDELYASNRLAIEELRVLMYDVAARRVLPRETVLSMVEGLKWDKKELPETYYPYVTKLLEKVGMASGQIQSLVPAHLHKSVWLSVVDVLMEHLLEALSRVKKCNGNGRAQMALDLATLYRGLEQISQDTSGSNRRHILGSFIKAYYFDSAPDFVSWMESGLAKGGEFFSDSILARRHFLSLITLEKSPLSKLAKKKRNELKTTVETVWMKAIIARQSESGENERSGLQK